MSVFLCILALCIVVIKVWPNMFMFFVMSFALIVFEIILHFPLIACAYFLGRAYSEGINPWLFYAVIMGGLEVTFYRQLKKENAP